MDNTVTITLSADEAIVLAEFASRFTDKDVLSIEHQAEARVLWDICAVLEKSLVVPDDYQHLDWKEILEKARRAVKDREGNKVDFILTINHTRPTADEDSEQYSVQFYDDAYYWFLYPLFEALAGKTGQMIDLYQDALFEADTLPLLKETVQEAKQLVEQQPAEWLVRTGTLTQPINKDLVMPVNKKKFLTRLDRLERLVDAAIDTGENILCFGD